MEILIQIPVFDYRHLFYPDRSRRMKTYFEYLETKSPHLRCIGAVDSNTNKADYYRRKYWYEYRTFKANTSFKFSNSPGINISSIFYLSKYEPVRFKLKYRHFYMRTKTAYLLEFIFEIEYLNPTGELTLTHKRLNKIIDTLDKIVLETKPMRSSRYRPQKHPMMKREYRPSLINNNARLLDCGPLFLNNFFLSTTPSYLKLDRRLIKAGKPLILIRYKEIKLSFLHVLDLFLIKKYPKYRKTNLNTTGANSKSEDEHHAPHRIEHMTYARHSGGVYDVWLIGNTQNDDSLNERDMRQISNIYTNYQDIITLMSLPLLKPCLRNELERLLREIGKIRHKIEHYYFYRANMCYDQSHYINMADELITKWNTEALDNVKLSNKFLYRMVLFFTKFFRLELKIAIPKIGLEVSVTPNTERIEESIVGKRNNV